MTDLEQFDPPKKAPTVQTVLWSHWAGGKRKPMVAAVRVSLGLKRSDIASPNVFDPAKLDAAYAALGEGK